VNKEYQLSTTYEQTIARALELGQRIVLPEPDQLFIDIDSDEDYERFCKAVRVPENLAAPLPENLAGC
jgi:hypothetical protein